MPPSLARLEESGNFKLFYDRGLLCLTFTSIMSKVEFGTSIGRDLMLRLVFVLDKDAIALTFSEGRRHEKIGLHAPNRTEIEQNLEEDKDDDDEDEDKI